MDRMSSPLLDMNGQVKISFGPGKMQAFIEVTARLVLLTL